MKPELFRKAQIVIKRHYDLNRWPTQAEVEAEVANVYRKRAKGNQDDRDTYLDASLSIAGVIGDGTRSVTEQ